MSRYRMNSHHQMRANQAYVLFDYPGGGDEIVAAWHFEYPRIRLTATETLADPMTLSNRPGLYEMEIEGLARGLIVARPTWMEDYGAGVREIGQRPPVLDSGERRRATETG